jgi:diaminopimelate epimerase
VAEQQDQYCLEHNGQSVEFNALSMGNPHMVIQVDDAQNLDINQLGPALESHPLFPERVNVGFMQVVDRHHFKLRVFERGVGETQACGSGACAAMVAGVQLGLLDNQAEASLLGGDLQLDWQGPGQPVMMTGATSLVFDGEIDL